MNEYIHIYIHINKESRMWPVLLFVGSSGDSGCEWKMLPDIQTSGGSDSSSNLHYFYYKYLDYGDC